jgi:bifunctional DNA-binding transcriptional regulator/antitoxin component of YhaV-PrlF toxin-antitoxin module
MESKVFQVRPSSPSLRATVPEAVAKTLKLKHGDKLVWEIETRDDQLVVVVKKARVE